MLEMLVPILLICGPSANKLDLTIVVDDKRSGYTSWSDVLQSQWNNDHPEWNRRFGYIRHDIEAKYNVKFVHRLDAPCRCESYPAFIVDGCKPFYRTEGEMLFGLRDRLLAESDAWQRVTSVHTTDFQVTGDQWSIPEGHRGEPRLVRTRRFPVASPPPPEEYLLDLVGGSE